MLVVSVAVNVSVLHQFTPGTWVENIAARRSNGHVFVVLFDRPEVYEIDPIVSPVSARLVATFPNATGIQGIVETAEDGVFAMMPFAGSDYSLWTVDADANTAAEVIAHIPDAGTLNGLTKLGDNGLLLASDTKMGRIVRLDLRTRSSSIALADDTMIGLPVLGVGINGLRYSPTTSTLTYTNFYKGIVCRVPVFLSSSIFNPLGPIQILASGLVFLDDLAVDEDGTAYVMQYFAGSIAKIGADGMVETIAGGLDFPTSAAIGHDEEGRRVLYVSSTGNPVGMVAKGFFEGGKVYTVVLDD